MNSLERDGIRTFYNEYWSSRYASREDVMREWWAPAFEHLYGLMGDLSGKTIIELGAGEGSNAARLASMGARVCAVDFSDRSMEVLKTSEACKKGMLLPVQGDAHQLPFASGSVDAAMITNMLMFVDKERVLSECRRVVRPGGSVYLLEPLRYPHIIMLARLLEPHHSRIKYIFLSLGELSSLSRMFSACEHREFLLFSSFVVLAARLFPGSRALRKIMSWTAVRESRITDKSGPLRNFCFLTVARLRV